MREILILGCGYTGGRLAARLTAQGHRVTGLHRSGIDFTELDAVDRLARLVRPGMLVVHSVPSLPGGEDRTLLAGLGEMPARVLYLSTTGVYGRAEAVNETTEPAPESEREWARLRTEKAVSSGPWPSLILRPAAIYGPGRGVHVAMREGRYTLLGQGLNYISRIHVDDLVSHAQAGLFSEVTGAWPVGDERPCPSREIAEYCARRLGLQMPTEGTRENVAESRRRNRRVDGSAIRERLGIRLRYPSYREGIEAALREEMGLAAEI